MLMLSRPLACPQAWHSHQALAALVDSDGEDGTHVGIQRAALILHKLLLRLQAPENMLLLLRLPAKQAEACRFMRSRHQRG